MLELIRNHQIEMLFTCGVVCVVLSLLVMIIKFHSTAKKKALIKMELGTALLMFSEAFSYIYRGDTSKLGFWMVRIFNFLVFFMLLAAIHFLNQYVVSLFMETGKYKRLPIRLLVGFAVPTLGMILCVVSAFTGLYYYFDQNNIYQRGPLYIVSYVMPFIALLSIFSFVAQNKKNIESKLYWAMATFGVLPFLAGVTQIFLYGFSLIPFSTWISAVVLVALSLADQNDELTKAANTELGSGLPNSYGFRYEVDRIIQLQDITKYNAFYFDIIRMSQFNNKYGKDKGDEILYNYAQALKEFIEKDEVVGRLGGNYFVALVKKMNTDKFLKFLTDVKVEIEFDDHPEIVRVAAVTGCYAINTKNITFGQIMGYTSAAVSYAKNVIHKPFVFLDDELDRRFKESRHLEELTRKGIQNAEFVPFYQPKVDSDGNVMFGAEALARWRHDDQLISPTKFVPIMEKSGSICDLDFFILEKVCSDIKEWLMRDIEPVTISVNFSRRNLGNPILAEAISKTVEKYEIPKKYIQIEITETLDDYPLDYLIGVVEALHRYGLQVAIDDFGTGSTSINLIKRVSFEFLKVDKDFIDYTNEKEKQLLFDMIRMAQNVGTNVIAEGVEEKERVEDLKKMGCTLIQGYVYDKPLEKYEFENKLKNRQY